MLRILGVILISINCVLLLGQNNKTNTLKGEKDSTSQDVPDAIRELVIQYDKQVKEAKALQLQKRIVDPPATEIDGIVIDETMTKSGREFYEIYFSHWVKPTDFRDYYIKIKERPFQMNSTLIEVYLKDHLLYQQLMKRRYDEVEQMAKHAVEVVKMEIDRQIAYHKALKQKFDKSKI